jgi:hypothetical protein
MSNPSLPMPKICLSFEEFHLIQLAIVHKYGSYPTMTRDGTVDIDALALKLSCLARDLFDQAHQPNVEVTPCPTPKPS